LKMLQVARRLGATLPVTVRTTFLGAHAIPAEFAADRRAYVDQLCEEMIPAVAAAGLADAVDCFCESIAFTAVETERIFSAAHSAGLPVKIHAEQLSHSGGTAVAARYGALSADHLEYLAAADIDAMAAAGTIAVLLPGAYYALRETRCPPVAALRAAGVPIAVGSDCNPGSSPVLSLRLMMNMACTLFGLTPLEALEAVTVNATRALGLPQRGRLVPGWRADLALWDIAQPAELAYAIGGSLHLGTEHASIRNKGGGELE